MFKHYEGFISKSLCEHVVEEVFDFKRKYYTEENLKSHLTYFSDDQPGRTSSAYAVQSQCKSNKNLPAISIWHDLEVSSLIASLTEKMYRVLNVIPESRMLLNLQEYYSDSAPVPEHFDGELLDFDIKEGKLNIHRAIRPRQVAVLVLVNEAGQVGTRIHKNELSNVVVCNPGDLLIFDNIACTHSVDSILGSSNREDKLLRMTIGWRSLADDTYLHESRSVNKISKLTNKEANDLTRRWLDKEWPLKYAEIKNKISKAAF